MKPTSSLVSIPLWCDCDCLFCFESNHCGIVSIPLWCDCDRVFNCLFKPFRRFQSHCGAIATRTVSFMLQKNTSFNPTVVRLRQQKEIRTSTQYLGFNPTVVRLRLLYQFDSLLNFQVSIPLWC
ncbi:MAG: hypothetical protein RMK89_14415, partial [Armatimonadota bacterium]|nr:hypothetical protein [Armatimonadota bacterium]MDW8144639.1 hypothetical protein [Armatimonadota bacterium]